MLTLKELSVITERFGGIEGLIGGDKQKENDCLSLLISSITEMEFV